MDGEIDYSNYSLEELREVQRAIDGDAYPINFANLQREIRKRAKEYDSLGRAHQEPDRQLNLNQRLFDGGIAMILIAVLGVVYIEISHRSDQAALLESQLSRVTGIAQSDRVERFINVGRLGRRNPYYEYAVYVEDGTRFFIRSPHRESVSYYGPFVRNDEPVEILYLPEAARNGGYRIAQLQVGQKILLTLDETRADVEYNAWFAQSACAVFLVPGVGLLILWWRRQTREVG